MHDSNCLRVLVLGDVIGDPGMRALFSSLKKIKNKEKPHFVIVNGENAADGFGLLPNQSDQLFTYGADVITSGNHIWQREELIQMLDKDTRLLRPSNYPKGVPGHGTVIIDKGGFKLGVINLQGRIRMPVNCECPFKQGLKDIKKLKSKTNAIIIDFHAEDVTEKESLAEYFDGKASAVVGTHTHVQTADERILDGGTAYISDIGMVGTENGIIGFDPIPVINRVLTSIPHRTNVLDEEVVIKGVVINIDTTNGKAKSIKRISYQTGNNG